jgi:NADH-ubiquinone oxidoreductase chain 3
MVLSLVLCSYLLVLLLKVVSFIISESSTLQREELTPYECGFEHHNLSRIPFSLRYILLTLVFLLFDLEIVLILFLPAFMFTSYSSFSLLVVISFLAFLIISLFYE